MGFILQLKVTATGQEKKELVSSSLPYPDVSFSVLHCLMGRRECQGQVNKQEHKPAHK